MVIALYQNPSYNVVFRYQYDGLYKVVKVNMFVSRADEDYA